jgi:hypothetical protein
MNHIVFIDEFGQIVEESKSKYKVFLQGSYQWAHFRKGWYFDVEKTIPALQMKTLFSTEMLIKE